MISICIATFNGEKYIKQQLDTILPQLNANDEIIISDDSSTDNTIQIIKSLNDKRIRIFENQTFYNPIFNFENALKQAKGETIYLSDQDDLWHSEKIKITEAALNNYDLVVSDCTVIDDYDKVLIDSYFKTANSSSGFFKNLKKNSYIGCCMAFKRKVLNAVLPFPKDIPMHDIWLGFIGELFFKTYFLNQVLTYYRKHSLNASITTNIVSHYNIFKKIMFRYNLLKYLPKILRKRFFTSNE